MKTCNHYVVLISCVPIMCCHENNSELTPRVIAECFYNEIENRILLRIFQNCWNTISVKKKEFSYLIIFYVTLKYIEWIKKNR